MSITMDRICLSYGYSTGKRTKTGAFEDLTKSLMRYVKNNYMDGARQDGFDLALGVYRVSSTSWEDSPYNMDTPLVIHMVSQSRCTGNFRLLIIDVTYFRIKVPLAVLLSAIMCVFGVMLISYSGITSNTLICLFIAFWFSLLVTTFHYMLQNSQCYVDWPRLVTVPGQPDSDILKPSTQALTSTYLPRKFGKQAQRRSSKELSALEKGDQIPLKKMS
jgi:phosphatidylinositol 4-phosphatase